MPYFWGAGIKREAASGSDIDISLDTILDDLMMAFMYNFEARKSRWSLAAHAIYLNLWADGGGTVILPSTAPPRLRVGLDADVKLRAWTGA